MMFGCLKGGTYKTMEQLKLFIETLLNNQYIIFLSILFLNIFSSCLGNLKTIFMAKQVGKTTYYLVLVDALVYSLVLKSFTSSGVGAIIAYVLGKFIGAIIADVVEGKMAIGIYDIRLFVSTQEKMYELQEMLLEKGFSSTANIGMLNNLKVRCSLNVQIARKDMNLFMDTVKSAGIEEPTMIIQEVKKVSGKITKRIV